MSALSTFPCLDAAAAEKPAALEADFLEYLLNYEGKDDNWTVVADGKVREQARELAKRAKQRAEQKVPPQEQKP